MFTAPDAHLRRKREKERQTDREGDRESAAIVIDRNVKQAHTRIPNVVVSPGETCDEATDTGPSELGGGGNV